MSSPIGKLPPKALGELKKPEEQVAERNPGKCLINL